MHGYRVLNEINRGGFGVVERVVAPDGSVVARKTFQVEGRRSPEDLEKLRRRFQREVRVQSRLSGDYFLPVLQSDLTGSAPWFTMPVADRNYVQQIVEDRAARRISPQPLADILAGLEELHSLGFTHRDLKPGNVLLHNGRWKLSDFGLVLPPETDATAQLTSTTSAWGTREYAAPEQATRFHSVTAAADIYSFGCILHDLELGLARIPFHKATSNGPLGPIIEKCTEVLPAKRFKSVGGLRAALVPLLLTPLAPTTNPDTKAWVEWLNLHGVMVPNNVQVLITYLQQHEREREAIFYALDDDNVGAIQHAVQDTEPELFEELANMYAGWASTAAFQFSYCDVVIKRLEAMLSGVSLGTFAVIAVAAATLGSTHDRWFVEDRVLRLCGPQMPEHVARRVAIEIHAEDAARHFVACARGIDRDISAYHPLITAALTP